MVYTFFCEQKLYIASDCAIPRAKTRETLHKNSRKGEQKLWEEIQKTWYIAQCWARKEGYKRAPLWLGQHYPAWPHLAQCNQCVPAYLVWAVFRDLASFWRRLLLLKNNKVSKSVSSITLQGSTFFQVPAWGLKEGSPKNTYKVLLWFKLANLIPCCCYFEVFIVLIIVTSIVILYYTGLYKVLINKLLAYILQ